MNYKQKLTIIFFIIIFSLSFYISWIYAIPNLVFSIAFYSVFIYFLYALVKKFKNKNFSVFDANNYKIFLNEFLYRVSSLIIAFIIIIWWFSFYQNDINPAKMPIFTITNWDKIVVFHAMSHIWTPTFYEKVKENIKNLKSQWYVLYFEWIKPWTKENHEAFNKALWFKFDKKTYENLSKIYWLISQDNEMFLNQVNDKDFNVDISIDEIMEKYKNLKIKTWNENRVYKEPIDIDKLVMNELAKLKENELKVLRYINKSFINLIIKSEDLQNAIQREFENKELFDVILNERNKIIAEKIITSPDKKIVATYWLLHFSWVFELLKQNDIKWRIIRIDYLYPVK